MKTHADREAYWTDLSDAEWSIIEPLVPAVKEGGRPADYTRREVVNAIRYLNRTSCAWRLLPHDLPPYRTVFAYFCAWQADGTWELNRSRFAGSATPAGRQEGRTHGGRGGQPEREDGRSSR